MTNVTPVTNDDAIKNAAEVLQFSVDGYLFKKALLEILRAANTAYSKRNQTSSMIFFTADKNGLALTTYGDQFKAEKKIGSNTTVRTAGKICLLYTTAKVLAKSMCEQSRYTFTGDKRKLTVYEYEEEIFKLHTAAIDNRPPSEELTEYKPHLINLSQRELKRMLNKTLYATSTEISDFTLQAVNFKVNNGILTLTATDRYRLAMTTTQFFDSTTHSFCSTTGDVDRNLHNKVLNFVQPLLKESDDDVKICFKPFCVEITFGDWAIQTRCVGGLFPNVTAALPTSSSVVAKVIQNDTRTTNPRVTREISPLQVLIETIKFVSPLNDGEAITFEFKDGSLQIGAANSYGSARRTLEAEVIGAENGNARASFKAKYLLDVLGTLEGHTATFELSEKLAAIREDNSVAVFLPVAGSVQLPKKKIKHST